jgi:UDP-glucose 4-epimerase
MTIAVLGGAGFVGRALAQQLAGRDDVLFADVGPSPFAGSVPYSTLDITDATQVRNVVRGRTSVIHLAAHPLTASLKDPLENARVNILGSLTILDACRAEGVKKVVFTSASSLVGTPSYNPVDEAHPVNPKTPYGVAKHAVENYLRVYQEIYGLDHLTFRFYNVYGPGQLPASGALIPMVLARMLKNEPIQVNGDGSAARDFIFVKDVADLLVRACGAEPRNAIVNMGTGELTSIQQIVDHCSKALGVTPTIQRNPPRPGEISNFSADTTLLRKLFDGVKFTPVSEGIQATADWLRAQG